MKTMMLLVAGLLGSTALAPIEATASYDSPEDQVCRVEDHGSAGPFELRKETVDPHDGHARLVVVYRGHLGERYAADEISIWVRINGRDALVPAHADERGDAVVELDSGPRSCVWCGLDLIQSDDATCGDVVLPPSTDGAWQCEQPSELEAELFADAFDRWGSQTAWEVELAAEAGGEWDGRQGDRFTVRFEPRAACW